MCVHTIYKIKASPSSGQYESFLWMVDRVNYNLFAIVVESLYICFRKHEATTLQRSIIMRIKFLSDIHYDAACSEKMRQIEAYGKDADLLLISGDFGNSFETIRECLEFVSNSCRQFVFVLGNHDITVTWDCDIRTSEDKIRKIEDFAGTLGNGTMLGSRQLLTMVDDVLIGGTMGIWDYQLDDYRAEYEWKSRWFDGLHWGPDADIRKVSSIERGRLDIITKAKPKIVLTHFAPWQCNTNPMYRGSDSNKYFYFSVDGYDLSGIEYWGCGHTHDAHRLTIGDTCVMLNPLGYGRHEESPFSLNGLTADDFTVNV